MLVFDNIVYSLQRAGGVSRFWSKITEPYQESGFFIERADAKFNIYREGKDIINGLSDHFLPKSCARYVNFQRKFSIDPYIFHSSYYRVNNNMNAINVTTIHDLIYEKFGGGGGVGARLHILQKKNSLVRADCIVCVSENTRNDLYDFYPFCRDKKVIVIPNGVDRIQVDSGENPVSAECVRCANKSPFFIFVGNRGSCKGFDRVYSALRHRPSDWRCVVVGDPLTEFEIHEIERIGLSGKIDAVGRISDIDLAFLYSNAEFLFFPSLYEGFGIPPLEAMQCGCPVLASDRSSIPEVVGDAAILFDPDSVDELIAGMEKLSVPGFRCSLIEKGYARARMFDWSSSVDKYGKLYNSLLSSFR